jgi:hypothetical protein
MTTPSRNPRLSSASSIALVIAALIVPRTASAIPSFARKYGTSCVTCHTVFPKLTPFGEAFRRNGFRFPGVDGDFVKQEQVPLGQEAQQKTWPRNVWPASLPAGVPLSFAADGNARIHPDKNSSAAVADNGSVVTLHDLIGEAHLFAGGSFTERITYFAQITVGTDGSIDIEDARLLFNDLFKLKHAINLWAGKGGFQSLNSFGLHSSYIADTMVAPLAVTGLYGAKSEAWALTNNFIGAEVNGTIGGRFNYAVGVNGGSQLDVRVPQDVYGHVGFKVGGMRLDGETPQGQAAAPANVDRPWEETSLTVDGFVYRSASHFQNGNGTPQDDTALAFGGHARLQLRSFELNVGAYQERHDHATLTGGGVNALSAYGEMSYMVNNWIVPAVRIESSYLDVLGADSATDLRIRPGIAALLLANLKLVLSAQIEWASGLAPTGGWGAANGFAAPPAAGKTVSEIEQIQLTAWFAF